MIAHTREDHEEEQSIKFLSHEQKSLVATAVKVAAMQTAKQLMQNLESSPTRVINRSLLKSGAPLVRQERNFFTGIALEGLEVSNSLGLSWGEYTAQN